jgi:hypothetical protein
MYPSDNHVHLKPVFFEMKRIAIIPFLLLLVFPHIIKGQEAKPAASAEELAKKLANPVASLISVPFQNNTDWGIGEYNGSRNTMNFQPVVPIKLSSKLNLISRVIIPVITQQNITALNEKQSGMADAVLSGFISPAESKNGFTWGAGPVMLLPIATNDLLGSKKFGVGPTVLVLKQFSGWTIGALVNQIWSIAGDENRSDINQFFFQQFTVYNWKSGAGIGLNSEWTQNWESTNTTIVITPQFSGVTKMGNQTVQLLIGPRLPLVAPEGGKADFGVRAQLVFVFPR